MVDIVRVADDANMIVGGYAFSMSEEENGVRILNLNNPQKALVLSKDDNVIETTMDDIEIQIVKDYFKKNKEFLEG